MTPRELIRSFRAAGGMLQAEGGRLRYRAPARMLTESVRAMLQAEKPTILRLLAAEAAGWTGDDATTFLRERATLREECGLSHPAAERLAWTDLDRVLGIAPADGEPLTLEQIASLFGAEPVGEMVIELSLDEEAEAISVYDWREQLCREAEATREQCGTGWVRWHALAGGAVEAV